MSLVFVCLVGDENTREARDLARRLAQRLGSSPVIEGESPAPEDVHQALRAAVQPVGVVVFGHDGAGSLRSTSAGLPWADAPKLGALFPDLRVYAFACDTMGERGAEDLEALGHRAVDAGVAAFLGHCCVVSSALAADPDGVVDAYAAMLEAYFGGECDLARLRAVAQDAFDALEALESKGIGAVFAVSLAVRAAVNGLRLALRTAPVPEGPKD